MIDIKQGNSYANSCEDEILYFKCEKCNRKLRINQISRKKIDENAEFMILIYYCRKCDHYILRFKTLYTEEKGIL